MLYKIKLFDLHYKYIIKDHFSIVYKNLTSLLDNRENRDNIFEYNISVQLMYPLKCTS